MGSAGKAVKILVIRGGGVGDFVLTLPMLKRLKEYRKGAFLHLVGQTGIAAVAAGQGYFDSISELSDPLMAGLFRGHGPRSLELQNFLSQYELAVSFLNDSDGVLKRNLTEFIRKSIFVTTPDGTKHAAEHFVSHLETLGLETELHPPRVVPSKRTSSAACRWLDANTVNMKRPVVAIHPGSGSRKKNWPPRHYGAVIDSLHECRIEALLIEGEADSETVPAVLKNCQKKPAVARDLPLTTLAGVLAFCHSFLGNDSGISHLAASIGVPVTVLFGPTSPQVWRPLGPQVKVVTFDEAHPNEIAREICTRLTNRS